MRGIGDDCALVAPAAGHELSITTDMLVEGRHFLPGADPRALGHKSLAVNLSDLAAGGATPRWFTLALGLPATDERWLEAFSAGLFALAGRHGIELIGGDTTRAPQLTLTITALGESPAGQSLSRGGAKAGDDLWVSGEIGGASLAIVHPEIAQAARRLHEPEPRVALGAALRGLATAAIDVSDGLASDLGHIVERSGIGARVDYLRIPASGAFSADQGDELRMKCVLSGGDDYELLFSAPASSRARVEALSQQLGLGLTRIGAMVPGAPRVEILGKDGKPIAWAPGFDHFGGR